ncbi:cation diffusion facilitator family transporter [Deinococcus radiophilus]|uniref:Cation transporter n=1 Tax=Deinococcus radiophilus TaxID=32062 RepID=A0A3S0IBR4_9DEIO|nr:cation diffusion facilitator family transporter [Deinococcus radiophilus]RTR29001.1 cation transporter [Deinococcus radiophilus]UFA49584.1 cation diffusion facilitator family transporter [Deinococcus radiophilus]
MSDGHGHTEQGHTGRGHTGHSHGGHGQGGHNHGAGATARQLTIALVLTGTFLVVEAVYALLTGSLALLSDAGHMLTDVTALALSLLAVKVGQRPADRQRTFGYRRTEIMAAAVNAAVLLAIGFYILFEAVQRLLEPTEVQTLPMLIVAALGLVVNLISARVLIGGDQDSLNVRSAYLEVMSDLLGSVAVIAGALIIMFTGWNWVDPLLGALIGLWVVPRTWSLLRASVNVLMEGVPEGIDLDALRADLAALPGVTEVHDLHVWSVTSGQNNLTTHLVSERGGPELIHAAQEVAGRYDIGHVTVQLELPGHHSDPGVAARLHP